MWDIYTRNRNGNGQKEEVGLYQSKFVRRACMIEVQTYTVYIENRQWIVREYIKVCVRPVFQSVHFGAVTRFFFLENIQFFFFFEDLLFVTHNTDYFK